MQRINIESSKVGDILTFNKEGDEPLYLYNIVLSKNQHGVKVMQIGRRHEGTAFISFSRYRSLFYVVKLKGVSGDAMKFEYIP